MATISWISTSGGDWSTGANWQGGVVPSATDDAVMNLAAAETITVSTTQHVHSVGMSDPAATFVVTSAGALDAAGNVVLNVGNAVVDGRISSGGNVDIASHGSLSFGPSSGLTVGTVTAVIPESVERNGSGGTVMAVSIACFAQGTHIATPTGETPVETLAVGDLVCLANGKTAPITWIGHRNVECCRHPNPDAMRPVRIRQGAFADNLPHRDLILSPDHAVYCDGMLIPVRFLLNGCTLMQEAWDRVMYFHVELPRHELLLAEGLTVESYLETGGREAFANGGAVVRLMPDFTTPDPGFVSREWDAKGVAPLVITGPAVERTRHELQCRARMLQARAVRPIAGKHRKTA